MEGVLSSSLSCLRLRGLCGAVEVTQILIPVGLIDLGTLVRVLEDAEVRKQI